MKSKLVFSFCLVFVSGTLFSAADYSMVPQQPAEQVVLFPNEEYIEQEVLKGKAQIKELMQPVQKELRRSFPKPETLLALLQNSAQLTTFAKKLNVESAVVKSACCREYIQQMFAQQSNDAARFNKFIFSVMGDNKAKVANLLLKQAAFATYIDGIRRYCKITSMIFDKFPDGVFSAITVSENLEYFRAKAQQHSLNPRLLGIASPRGKALFLQSLHIFDDESVPFEKKVALLEKLVNSGCPEIEKMGYIFAERSFNKEMIIALDQLFWLLIKAVRNMPATVEWYDGRDQLSKIFRTMISNRLFQINATQDLNDNFRRLLPSKAISSCVATMIDIDGAHFAYDFIALCEVAEELVYEYHQVIKAKTPEEAMWDQMSRNMNDYSQETRLRRALLLEKIDRVMAAFESRSQVYEFIYASIREKLKGEAARGNVQLIYSDSLFEVVNDRVMLPVEISRGCLHIQTLSVLSPDFDQELVAHEVPQPKANNSPKIKKKNETKNKKRVQGNTQQSQASKKVILLKASDLATSSDGIMPERCPSPICGYNQRIKYWFDPAVAAQHSRQDVLYHSFALIADIWLIKYGKRSRWESSRGVDIVYSLKGEIRYPDQSIQYACFTCTLNKQNQCYHRGIISTDWDSLQQKDFDPEVMSAMQHEGGADGFVLPKEQLQKFKINGQIVEKTDEIVIINDLYNNVQIALYLP